ncbi:MAG: hypothetical protein PW786_10680 [Arachidicoccus sp.]|nr:hypothetical protein [Arachidicoccus sp.]
MRKKILQTGLVAITFLPFIACRKQSTIKNNEVDCIEYTPELDTIRRAMCTTDLCNQYLAVWKDLFMKQNNIDENFFEKHITLHGSGIDDWNDGESFGIYYKFSIGWASATIYDQFIIKIASGNGFYPALNLPRGQYLTEAQIDTVIQHKVFSAKLDTIANSDILLYDSTKEALDTLIKKTGVNKLCNATLSVGEKGHLILSANAQYANKENYCIFAWIDLQNGTTNATNGACYLTTQ